VTKKKEDKMRPCRSTASRTPKKKAVPLYQADLDPATDAWVTAFFIENHLDYYSYPDQVASPEQIRFMVRTEPEDRYYPCTDQVFEAIIFRNNSALLQEAYQKIYQRMLHLIDEQIEDEREKQYLKALVSIKYRHETRDEFMIPSRLEKRLMKIFINRTQIEDPCLFTKISRNQRVHAALNSRAYQNAINSLDSGEFATLPQTLAEFKNILELLELKRLLTLCVEKRLWEDDGSVSFKETDYQAFFSRQITGDGWTPLLDFLGLGTIGGIKGKAQPRKILWLADQAGEFMVDIAIIRHLAKRGHKIVIAFKEAPIFTTIDFYDAQEDAVLRKELANALWIKDRRLGKNELIRILRSEENIIVVSDGSRETLNLLLCSTAFARTFKEVDGVISRGVYQRRHFFETRFQFTQDIFNISAGPDHSVDIRYKPRHPSVIKFSHEELEKRASAIIARMDEAKRKGMIVMFYSGIIGSIPGKLKVAQQVMNTFIGHLKEQSSKTFIINPSEYFETGMDADDLMYMWEIVQRSGLIDIWRFQSYDDIFKSFQLMSKKVPPEWVGKDATYSTGCTKEMKIALDVQQKNPEMQIIGPSREKFMRRGEYGIGKLYDQSLQKYQP